MPQIVIASCFNRLLSSEIRPWVVMCNSVLAALLNDFFVRQNTLWQGGQCMVAAILRACFKHPNNFPEAWFGAGEQIHKHIYNHHARDKNKWVIIFELISTCSGQRGWCGKFAYQSSTVWQTESVATVDCASCTQASLLSLSPPLPPGDIRRAEDIR